MNEEKIEDSLECRTHAENLYEGETPLIPVRIIVSSISVFEHAEMLVQVLTDSSQAQLLSSS